MKELNQSQTVTIKRSEIKLNPCNPKRHTDSEIKKQLSNFKKSGYLGGIVWNRASGNLLDGHRRVLAMDLFYKYDGTNDYDIKVEAVDFDRKKELNQLTYMALGNTKADYNLVAKYASDIDPSDAGISDDDYKRIMELVDNRPHIDDIPDLSGDFLTEVHDLTEDLETNDDIVERHENKPKMTKEEVKGEKAHCDNVAMNRQNTQDLYVFMSFESIANKQAFCDLMGYQNTNSMLVRGEEVLNMIK